MSALQGRRTKKKRIKNKKSKKNIIFIIINYKTILMETTNFQTEQEKKFNELKRKLILSTCVSCEQQLSLFYARD